MSSHSGIVRLLLAALLCVLFCSPVRAEEGREVVTFAVANGYPPYQFRSDKGDPIGLDIDVIKLVAEKMGVEIRIVQGPWDDMVTALRVGRVDCVGGMEINGKRLQIFDFTDAYYSRKAAVFTLKDNLDIQTLEDLTGKIITGDRHSYVEQEFTRMNIKHRIRIRQTESKDKSLRLLKQGEVVAMVAPRAVGYYLASRHNVVVRIIDDSDPGSPVGIAVIKGNMPLLHRLDKAMDELRANGRLDQVLRKWQIK